MSLQYSTRTQTTVVEDSPIGISAAISAGVSPVHYNPKGLNDIIEGVHQISDMNNLLGLIKAIQ